MNSANKRFSLSSQILRDLAWIFSSAPMIQSQNLFFEQTPLNASWLKAMDNAPDQINSHMATKNLGMLGTYFEALWEFYLLYYPGKRLIKKNLQVFENNKTLGEFDFIYFDESSNEYRHLEVAIKYYLGVATNQQNVEISPNKSSMQCWIGPDAHDRLDKKYTKMVEHQSKLSQTIAGRKVLSEFSINEVKSEVCLLGYLFYPMGGQILPPEFAHHSHNQGHWLKLNQIDKYLASNRLWSIMEKPHWIAPIIMKNDELDTRENIISKIKFHFSNSSQPLLISNFIPIGKMRNSLFCSENKYFIMPESWP